MSANSPCSGVPVVAMFAVASSVVRPGSYAQTIVREAWKRPIPRSRLAISPLHSRSTMHTRFSARATTKPELCA